MTGLLEIARVAKVGLTIDLDAIPIPAESALLCREFGLDPLGTIASGAILMTAAQADAGHLCALLAAAGYPTTPIGAVTPAADGLVARRAGQPVAWPVFAADEVTRLFG